MSIRVYLFDFNSIRSKGRNGKHSFSVIIVLEEGQIVSVTVGIQRPLVVSGNFKGRGIIYNLSGHLVVQKHRAVDGFLAIALKVVKGQLKGFIC